MDFKELLKTRQFRRKYKSEQITKKEINLIMDAANHAPVGSNLYKNIL